MILLVRGGQPVRKKQPSLQPLDIEEVICWNFPWHVNHVRIIQTKGFAMDVL